MNENSNERLSENKKSESNKSIILTMILIILLIFMGLCFYKFNEKITDLQNDNKELKKQIKSINKSEENSGININGKKEKTVEEIVKELFLERKATDFNGDTCKIVELNVTSVRVITGQERQDIIDMDKSTGDPHYINVSEKDIFAHVTYSEKYADDTDSLCFSVNGEKGENNWVNNEGRNVYIKYETGNYKIDSIVTGW